MAAGPNVIVEQQGAVTTLKLSYPEKRNALSMPLREKLRDALKEALADDNCRVIVLTGDGGHFSSGGDISGFDGVNAINGRKRMQKPMRWCA